MASTRTFKSLGVIASNAVEVTEPGIRDQGVAYRRSNLSDVPQLTGEEYDEPPVTENINQKLFNQSSFTDFIDRTGVLGWTNLVNYSPPAIVLATNGQVDSGGLYECLKPSGPANGVGVMPIDPALEDQSSPDKFWLLIENPEELELDLANQTPGEEGALLVGHNYIDVVGVDEGLEVKNALDDAFNAIKGFGMNILASAHVIVEYTREDVPVFLLGSIVGSHKNVAAADVEPIPELDGVGDPTNNAQGTRITFTDPIPTPYSVQITAHQAFDSIDFDFNRNTIAYGNLLSTSCDVYYRQHTNHIATEMDYLMAFSIICYQFS